MKKMLLVLFLGCLSWNLSALACEGVDHSASLPAGVIQTQNASVVLDGELEQMLDENAVQEIAGGACCSWGTEDKPIKGCFPGC